jgi:hypothetical protein
MIVVLAGEFVEQEVSNLSNDLLRVFTQTIYNSVAQSVYTDCLPNNVFKYVFYVRHHYLGVL